MAERLWKLLHHVFVIVWVVRSNPTNGNFNCVTFVLIFQQFVDKLVKSLKCAYSFNSLLFFKVPVSHFFKISLYYKYKL